MLADLADKIFLSMADSPDLETYCEAGPKASPSLFLSTHAQLAKCVQVLNIAYSMLDLG